MQEKEKFYLSLAVIFIAYSVFVWQGIIEAKESNDYKIVKIADKSATIAEYGLKEKFLPNSLSNYNFAVNKIAGMRKYFVNENDLPGFIKMLEDLADKTSNSTEISFIETGDKETKVEKRPSGFTLQLATKGNFIDLVKFISYLQNAPYYVYIDSVNIAIDTKKNNSEVKSVLVIRVFSFNNMSIRGL